MPEPDTCWGPGAVAVVNETIRHPNVGGVLEWSMEGE